MTFILLMHEVIKVWCSLDEPITTADRLAIGDLHGDQTHTQSVFELTGFLDKTD